MINVRELMVDPDFATHYTVLRTKGKWVKGRFEIGEPARLSFFGPVQPATAKELQQIPEGDRQHEVMKFLCAPPKKIYVTNTEAQVSDQIIYDGTLYRIFQVKNWRQNGYTRAFGCAIEEAGADV